VLLSNNSLFTTQAEEYTTELIQALKNNDVVTNVEVANCGISNSGAEQFAELLKGNKTIKRLDLSNNKIDSSGQQTIFVALKENSTLEELLLLGNAVPGEQCLTTLVETFDHNTTLLNIVWRLESRQSFKINQCITRNKEIERRKKLGKSIDDLDPNIRRETEKRILEERASGLPKFVAPEVEVEPDEAPEATGGPYALKVLQRKNLPTDVDPNRKEDYLSDEEFQQIFKTSRENFASSPQWKRKQAKKDAKLF